MSREMHCSTNVCDLS